MSEQIPVSAVVGDALKRAWWMILIRGILLVLLGVFALWRPDATVVALAIVFGAYAVVDGIVLIAGGVGMRRSYRAWGWLIADGVLSIIAGALALLLPGVAGFVGVLAFLGFVVGSSIIGGIGDAYVAARFHGAGRVWGVIAGILGVLFGILLLLLVVLNPQAAALAVVWVVGAYAIVFGIVLIVVSIQVRRGAIALAETPA